MTETESGLGIVGAGRAGSALAVRAAEHGLHVAVASRRIEDAKRLAERCSGVAREDPLLVLSSSPVTLLALPERALEQVAAQISRAGAASLAGRVVAHCAGALGPSVLAPLADAGASVGVFHPLAPIPDGDASSLDGAFVALDGDDEAVGRMSELATAIGCRWFRLAGQDRVLYHAAAVLAGVFPVMLEGAAEQLATSIGLGSEARLGLRRLLRLSAANVSRLGPTAGTSGPSRRGDDATFRLHLDRLNEVNPRLAGAYRGVLDLMAGGSP